MDKLRQIIADAWHTSGLDRFINLRSIVAMTPPSDWPLMWAYVGYTAFSLIAGIVLIFLKIHPSLKARISPILWTNVFLGPVLFFFRYETVPLLGMELWIYLQIIATLIWIIGVVRFARTGLRQEKLSAQALAYKEKYLPKAKA